MKSLCNVINRYGEISFNIITDGSKRTTVKCIMPTTTITTMGMNMNMNINNNKNVLNKHYNPTIDCTYHNTTINITKTVS